MIDYAQLKSTEVPQNALLAYKKYAGDQRAAESAKDYDALAKMQAWGAFIEAQQLTRKETVVTVLKSTFCGGSASWRDMSSAIKNSGLAITNWLAVRNVLQELIDLNYCKRSPDIHNEIYVLVNV